MRLRKIIAFALCVVLAFPLFACGKDAGSIDPGTDPGITDPNDPNDPNPDDPNPDDPNPDDPVTPTQYTITFDVGTEAAAANVTVTPSSITVDAGSSVGSQYPRPSTWAGHTFRGWYTGSTEFTANTRVIGSYTVTAQWSSDEEDRAAAQYEANIGSWSQAGHLYIHYKRYDHSEADYVQKVNGAEPKYDNAVNSARYSDWGLWMWPKNSEGRLFNAAWVDVSGAVYDVLIDHEYDDAGWDADSASHKDLHINYADVDEVGMQLFQISTREDAGFWSNDGGNNYLVLDQIKRADGSYHWFVNQGRVGSGKARFSNEVYENPYQGDDGTTFVSTYNINSAVDNSTKYPLAPKAAGYDEAGVGYQIFIASFADSDGDGMGDLRGIINKLDYLASLNVDVLWLTPFQSSTNYHGYDIDDYFSVDSRFGTLADYRELVYKVHKKGMKIVMDYVLNHTSQANPWFVKSKNLVKEGNIDYRNFYTWISEAQYNALSSYEKKQWFKDEYNYYYYSSFSSDMPELNYDYQPVRDAVLEVCNYWMAFGLDGFRLDAVKHIYMNNETLGKTGGNVIIEKGKTTNPSQVQIVDGKPNYDAYAYNLTRDLHFWREFNSRLKASYPNAFLVSENFDGDPAHIAPFYEGMDSQFNFNNYYDTMRGMVAAASSANGPSWNSSIATKTTSNYTAYSNKNGHYIDGMFTSNHDLPRARDRMNITTDGANDTYRGFFSGNKIIGTADANTATMAAKTEALLRLYYAYNMTMPGVSWIYYGDEIGMSGVMQFTVDTQSTSTTDSQPHEDRVYRQPMKWFDTVSQNSKFRIGYESIELALEGLNATNYVRGVDHQNTDNTSLLNWMRVLTTVRDAHPELINGKVTSINADNGFITYTVAGGGRTTKVYINQSSSAKNITGTPYTVSIKRTDGTAVSGQKSAYKLNGASLASGGVAIVQG